MTRVERRVRILEDYLHPTSEISQRCARAVSDLGAFELNRPGSGVDETCDHASRCRLSGTGLTDNTQCLSTVNVEGDVFYCCDNLSAAGVDFFPPILRRQQRRDDFTHYASHAFVAVSMGSGRSTTSSRRDVAARRACV